MPNDLQPTKQRAFIEKTASDTISKTLSTLLAAGVLTVLGLFMALVIGIPVWLYVPLGALIFFLICGGAFFLSRRKYNKATIQALQTKLDRNEAEKRQLQEELGKQIEVNRQLTTGAGAMVNAQKTIQNEVKAQLVMDGIECVPFNFIENREADSNSSRFRGFIADFLYVVDAETPSTITVSAKLEIKNELGERLIKVKEGFWRSDNLEKAVHLSRGDIGSLTLAIRDSDDLMSYGFGYRTHLGHRFADAEVKPINDTRIFIIVDLLLKKSSALLNQQTFFFKLFLEPEYVFEEIKQSSMPNLFNE